MKNLIIAWEPRDPDVGAVREIWQEIENYKLSGVTVIGIQPLSAREYTLISHVNDFRPAPGVMDLDVAPMLGLELLQRFLLTESYPYEINSEMFQNYLLQNATERGLALSGCGRIENMMPYARIISAYEPDSVIKQRCQNSNLNVAAAPIAPYHNPDIKKIASAAKTLIENDFEFSESRKLALFRMMQGIRSDSLGALGISGIQRR
jgi:hypothetical protein